MRGATSDAVRVKALKKISLTIDKPVTTEIFVCNIIRISKVHIVFSPAELIDDYFWNALKPITFENWLKQ